jgi:hypothetical protein
LAYVVSSLAYPNLLGNKRLGCIYHNHQAPQVSTIFYPVQSLEQC